MSDINPQPTDKNENKIYKDNRKKKQHKRCDNQCMNNIWTFKITLFHREIFLIAAKHYIIKMLCAVEKSIPRIWFQHELDPLAHCDL